MPCVTRSSTSSNCARLSSVYGAARRTIWNSSSVCHLRGDLGHHRAAPRYPAAAAPVRSHRAAQRAPRASKAVHSTSSSRVSGYSRPLGVPERLWFDRPTRCKNVAILRGEPIWHTSSTGPMSIPSSSDAVATSAFRSPARRRFSTRWRRSATGCRDARPPRRRPGARRAGAPPARPDSAY